MYRKVLILSFLLASLGVAAFAMGERLALPPAKSVPQPAIDFTLKDIEGKIHSLSSYKGKYVFLNFWATWCPPCRAEIPSMQKLYSSWDKNKYVMLAVNLEQDRKTVKSFARESGYTFPILLDEEGEVARKYKVRGIPTTYFINKEGKIIDRLVGSREWKLEEIQNIFK